MSEFYHDRLWTTAGAAAEKTLLWGGSSSGSSSETHVFLPYALEHPKMALGLALMLQDHLYAKFGGEKLAGQRSIRS